MTDVSMLGALLAGLVSFLSPCVLPLVPGYVSMLSGIGMEQLRQGQQPRAGLFVFRPYLSRSEHPQARSDSSLDRIAACWLLSLAR